MGSWGKVVKTTSRGVTFGSKASRKVNLAQPRMTGGSKAWIARTWKPKKKK